MLEGVGENPSSTFGETTRSPEKVRRNTLESSGVFMLLHLPLQ